MKYIIALIGICAIIVFVLPPGTPKRTDQENASSAAATPAPENAAPPAPSAVTTAPPTPAPSPVIPDPAAPSVTTAPASAASLFALLEPGYRTLLSAKTMDAQFADPGQLARFRPLLQAQAASPQRDAAIRLCSILERAATMTRETRARLTPPPQTPPKKAPRSSPDYDRLKKAEEEKTAFFNRGAVRQWGVEIDAIRVEAQAEWARMHATP